MSKSNVGEDKYISVDKNKLKEEQKEKLKKAMEAYEHECLKSFSATWTGYVIKKFDFPTLQPLTKVQRENRMLDMVHQAVGHAFVSHAPMMTNFVHNDVVKTLAEGTFQGYTRTSYQQPGQMNFTPVGSATITPPMTSQRQSDGSIGSTQPTNTTLPPQFNPIFTNSTMMTSSVQGRSMSGYPLGWDLATGLSMTPGSFNSSTMG